MSHTEYGWIVVVWGHSSRVPACGDDVNWAKARESPIAHPGSGSGVLMRGGEEFSHVVEATWNHVHISFGKTI